MRRVLFVVVVVMALGSLLSPPAVAQQRVVTAAFYRYNPTPVEVAPGDTLVFLNSDPAIGSWEGHSVTHAAPPGEQLFDSPITPPGGAGEVVGVAELQPGSYAVTCRVHAFMTGTVIVVGKGSAS